MSEPFGLFTKLEAFEALGKAIGEAAGEPCKRIAIDLDKSPPVVVFLIGDEWISATVDSRDDDALTAEELATLTAGVHGS